MGDESFIIYGHGFKDACQNAPSLIHFVKGDHLLNFSNVEPNSILVVHNSDEMIDSAHLSLLDNPNVLKLYCQNLNIIHKKVRLLPIGIANPEWPHGDRKQLLTTMLNQNDKNDNNMLYVNFDTRTFSGRSAVASKWSHMIQPRTSFSEYISALSRHKYCICPRGNGVDTHRYWESLYVQTIPIVLDDGSPFYTHLKALNLPTLYVSAWDEVTPALLEENYSKLHAKFKAPIADILSPLHMGYYFNLMKHAIVLVHLGEQIVPYVVDCVRQARVFNRCRIILIVDSNHHHYETILKEFNVDVVLANPVLYQEFTRTSQMSDGFWKRCSQRFFALLQIAERMSLTSFFHMENDIMLYQDLENIVNKCASRFPSCIGATFDNAVRGIPGFMYFADSACLKELCESIMRNPRNNDMQALRTLQKENPACISSLPIIPAGAGAAPGEYSNGSDFFECIFDAAYIGQYIAGTDQGHGPGFVNWECVVKPTEFVLTWQKNELGLWCPYADGTLINNLHIHKKNLANWSSLKEFIPSP